MNEKNTDSTGSKKPASTLAELAKEHGGVKNIPPETLASLGLRVVSEVMRGRNVTRVIPVDQETKAAGEADTAPKYPVTEITPKTKVALGALNTLKLEGEDGLEIDRDTAEIKGERKVIVENNPKSGNTVAIITDTSYPSQRYKNIIKRELEFAPDGSTVFAASIMVDKPLEGEQGKIERDPKVTEIAPAGLESFATEMLETIQQEVALTHQAE